MPKNPIKKKSKDDKFYTKPAVAKECIDFLKCFIKEDVLWIEPSAGNGSFSSQVDCLAYDIKPESENIMQQDWLSYKHTSSGEWVMFGNPPFGSRNILTKKFILKGIEQGCTYIGFVLPSVFEKYTNQTIFPDNWKLLGEMILPVNSFLLDGEDYHVPCVFQVWSCSEDFTQNYRNVKGKEFTDKFSFVKKHECPDLFMFGAAPTKLISPDEVCKNNRGYYLTTKSPLDTFISQVKAINWKQYGKSSVNGGVSWFTKSEIIEIWEKHYGSE